MANFILDTSGAVFRAMPRGRGGWFIPHPETEICWSDLDLFTQGYVEVLFASLSADYGDHLKIWTGAHFRWTGFSDLAPETLAAILKDCEGEYGAELRFSSSEKARDAYRRKAGARHWQGRSGVLTPYLGDDGKVYLREAA